MNDENICPFITVKSPAIPRYDTYSDGDTIDFLLAVAELVGFKNFSSGGVDLRMTTLPVFEQQNRFVYTGYVFFAGTEIIRVYSHISQII